MQTFHPEVMLHLVLLFLAPFLSNLYRQPRLVLSFVTLVDFNDNGAFNISTTFFNITFSITSSAFFLVWVRFATDRNIGEEYFNYIITPTIIR